MHGRAYIRPDGSTTTVYLDACKCGELSRGPKGGVCGRCCGAIPYATAEEMQQTVGGGGRRHNPFKRTR